MSAYISSMANAASLGFSASATAVLNEFKSVKFTPYYKIEEPSVNETSHRRHSFLFVLNFVAIKLVSYTVAYWQFDFMYLLLFVFLSAIIHFVDMASFYYLASRRASSLVVNFLLDVVSTTNSVSRIVIYAYVGSVVYNLITTDYVTTPEAVAICFVLPVTVILFFWIRVRDIEDDRIAATTTTTTAALSASATHGTTTAYHDAGAHLLGLDETESTSNV